MVEKHRQKYGTTFAFNIIGHCLLYVSDPKNAEAILSSQKIITKNTFYSVLEDWIGEGLLISNGKKWVSRRKIITPTFHFKILDQFVEVFDANSNILVEKLKRKADGKTAINIMPFVCLTALDIIAGKFLFRHETFPNIDINFQYVNIFYCQKHPWE